MGKPIDGQGDNQVGVIISGGAADWQIFQQDESGHASISLHGRWVIPPAEEFQNAGKARVQVRVVRGDSGAGVSHATDWQDTQTGASGTWKATIKEVPAGGLYRLETRLVAPGMTPSVWAGRGDMRHFIGVGDLWVIAGQSNSAGYGRGPIFDPPLLGVHLFRNSEQWALAAHPLNESTDTAHPVNREVYNTAHSPWLQFAKLVQQGTGHPIGLVQSSLGGSPLSDWNPKGKGKAPLWQNMRHCIAAVGGKVKGVLWYQGESDTGTDELANNYGRSFSAMVEAWRKTLRNPELAIVTVQLNRYLNVDDEDASRRWSMLRDQQRRVAQSLPRTVVVPALDLTLTDGIHCSSEGNMLLAERAARAALGAFYGQHIPWQAPDISSARKTGKLTVELSFDGVASFFSSTNPNAKPFSIEDDEDLVPIKGWSSTDHRIEITLERALRGPAAIHGGYGTNPESLPFDDARMMPMLAFFGVEIE